MNAAGGSILEPINASSITSESTYSENGINSNFHSFSQRKEFHANGITKQTQPQVQLSETAQEIEEIMIRQLAQMENRLRIALASDRARYLFVKFQITLLTSLK